VVILELVKKVAKHGVMVPYRLREIFIKFGTIAMGIDYNNVGGE